MKTLFRDCEKGTANGTHVSYVIQWRTYQGCKIPGCQVNRATNFHIVAPNMCGSSVRNMLHATIVTPRMLKVLLNCLCTPDYTGGVMET